MAKTTAVEKKLFVFKVVKLPGIKAWFYRLMLQGHCPILIVKPVGVNIATTAVVGIPFCVSADHVVGVYINDQRWLAGYRLVTGKTTRAKRNEVWEELCRK